MRVTLIFHDMIVKFPEVSHYQWKENGYDILFWQHKAKQLRKYTCTEFLWSELPEWFNIRENDKTKPDFTNVKRGANYELSFLEESK